MEREAYREKDLPLSEEERLKLIKYPNEVSEELLDESDLKGRKVLDAGAGPNSGLAKYINERGGMYVPLDVREGYLRAMKTDLGESNTPSYGVVGDVGRMPFRDGEFDVVHERFVLMNLVPANQKRAFEEMLRVAKDEVILMAYDWSAIGSPTHPEIAERFKRAGTTLLTHMISDPYFGRRLEKFVRDVSPGVRVHIRHFEREANEENVPELILICRSLRDGARMASEREGLSPETKERLEESAKEFTELIGEIEQASGFKFAPPEIVAATARKK